MIDETNKEQTEKFSTCPCCGKSSGTTADNNYKCKSCGTIVYD